jgi:rSAM/selenodomain-associated transferase 2
MVCPSELEAGSISVVIPTLNEADRILGPLASLGPGLDPCDEVIVVDGGSTDGTPELVRGAGLPQVRVIDAPRGRGGQLRAGAEAARGATLLFMHADTRPGPTTLDAVRSCTDPWGYFRVQLDDPSRAFRLLELGINLRSQAYGTPSGDQGIFVGRALLESVGGVPDVPFMEDLQLVDRLRSVVSAAPPVGWITTSARRWQRQGFLRTVARMWGLRLAYRLGVSPEWLVAS